MENERLTVIPWPKSFMHLQVASIVGLVAIICMLESTDVGAARIAAVSFLICAVIMTISLWNFLSETRSQNSVKETQ